MLLNFEILNEILYSLHSRAPSIQCLCCMSRIQQYVYNACAYKHMDFTTGRSLGGNLQGGNSVRGNLSGEGIHRMRIGPGDLLEGNSPGGQFSVHQQYKVLVLGTFMVPARE